MCKCCKNVVDVAPPFLKLQQCCILSSQIVSVRDIDPLFFLVRDIDQMVFETQELFPSQEVELRPNPLYYRSLNCVRNSSREKGCNSR